MPGHETDSLTDIAIGQLEMAAAADEPFFMLLSYQAPHPPCSPPAEFLEPYENLDLVTEANADREAWFKHEAWRADYDAQRFRQLYFGEISQLDAAFGRLLATMDRLGLRDNTLVVFTSDHGEMAGAHAKFGKGVMHEEALQHSAHRTGARSAKGCRHQHTGLDNRYYADTARLRRRQGG